MLRLKQVKALYVKEEENICRMLSRINKSYTVHSLTQTQIGKMAYIYNIYICDVRKWTAKKKKKKKMYVLNIDWHYVVR